MYWVTGILGLAFALSPFVLGFSNNPTAMWTSVFLGGITVFVSAVEGITGGKDRWEYFVTALAGLAIIVAPFVMGFEGIVTALWVSISVGIVLTAVASSKLYSDNTGYLG